MAATPDLPSDEPTWVTAEGVGHGASELAGDATEDHLLNFLTDHEEEHADRGCEQGQVGVTGGCRAHPGEDAEHDGEEQGDEDALHHESTDGAEVTA